ncbi:MAG: trypsin-like serine peptidase, partial [Solirubrobacteraceae bacterium]
LDWAQTQGTNPADPRWKTLGSLLFTLLKDGTLGLDGVAVLTSFIETYDLCNDAALRDTLRRRYGVPQATAAADAADTGPDFDWQGPTAELELQAFVRPAPLQYDMHYVATALRRARSVCRISVPSRERLGTGVLIAPGLVLTNHHVVFGMQEPFDQAADVAAVLKVEFLGIALGETDAPGAIFGLDDVNAIAASSRRLDYALLRLPETAKVTAGLEVAPRAARPLAKGGALNLLHHPGGEALSVTFGDAAVTGIYQAEGLAQYVTVSAGGSSGAPAFDGEWQLAALHHAVRARGFGRVGEGILLTSVLTDLAPHLGDL